MLVVSNTSPITNLAAVGALDVLRQLYGTVVIPQEVFMELNSPTKHGLPAPGVAITHAGTWIVTRPVSHPARIQQLITRKLDRGEVAAIVLAEELQATLILLDDWHARVLAQSLGLVVTGICGVLLEAKHAGAIPAVKPVLDALIAGPKFRVSPMLYGATLQQAGE